MEDRTGLLFLRRVATVYWNTALEQTTSLTLYGGRTIVKWDYIINSMQLT